MLFYVILSLVLMSTCFGFYFRYCPSIIEPVSDVSTALTAQILMCV